MKKFIFTFLVLEFLLLLALLLGSNTVQAQSVTLPNPLEVFGVRTPGQLITKSIQGFAGIIGSIAIAFTVFSGFKLVIATSEEAIESARKSITWSATGFMVALLSFTVISGVGSFIGFNPSRVGTNTLVNPLQGPQNPDDFISVLNYIMIQFLNIVGVVTVIMIIYYGYRYMSAAGNEEIIERAKSGLRFALAGLAVILLAYTIILTVQTYIVSGPP